MNWYEKTLCFLRGYTICFCNLCEWKFYLLHLFILPKWRSQPVVSKLIKNIGLKCAFYWSIFKFPDSINTFLKILWCPHFFILQFVLDQHIIFTLYIENYTTMVSCRSFANLLYWWSGLAKQALPGDQVFCSNLRDWRCGSCEFLFLTCFFFCVSISLFFSLTGLVRLFIFLDFLLCHLTDVFFF